MNYTHLNYDERYHISELRSNGISISDIARSLARNKSTISRELKRNVSQLGWRPQKAHTLALKRQQNSRNAKRICIDSWQLVQRFLRLDCSPDQAIQRIALETGQSKIISHETIYQKIYADRKAGGDLIQHLRGQKKYRKRYAGGQERRGVLKNRVSIDERPAIVDAKTRLGDWEGDTVIGKNHQGVLVTLVDRCSRFTAVRQLETRKAQGVSAAIQQMLGVHQEKCHTLTFDNGKEFADHEAIGKALNAAVYFAHPYHSWERGVNENTNGLIRQYFPKSTNLRKVTTDEVQQMVSRLNNRPRKCLGYRTPHEVFYGLEVQPLISSPVALRT